MGWVHQVQRCTSRIVFHRDNCISFYFQRVVSFIGKASSAIWAGVKAAEGPRLGRPTNLETIISNVLLNSRAPQAKDAWVHAMKEEEAVEHRQREDALMEEIRPGVKCNNVTVRMDARRQLFKQLSAEEQRKWEKVAKEHKPTIAKYVFLIRFRSRKF